MRKHDAEWEMPEAGTKSPTYRGPAQATSQGPGTEVPGGWRKGAGRLWLVGTEFLLGMVEEHRGWMVVMVHDIVNVLHAAELHTYWQKTVKAVSSVRESLSYTQNKCTKQMHLKPLAGGFLVLRSAGTLFPRS